MIFFLKEKYVKNSTEYYLVEYVESNWQFIIDHSMIDVAKQLHVNPSTLTRTVQKLGFSRYNAFRNYIIKKADQYEDLKPILWQEDFQQQVNNLYKANRFVIDQTFENLDLASFEQVINQIVNSQKIIFFGIGFSGFLGSQLSKYLRLSGMECIDILNVYDLIKFASIENNYGTWLIFSRTLTTKEITFGLKKIFENPKNKTIVFTNDKASIPSKIDYQILFSSLDENDNYFGLSSKISLMFILNLVIAGIMTKRELPINDKVLEFNLSTNDWKGKNSN